MALKKLFILLGLVGILGGSYLGVKIIKNRSFCKNCNVVLISLDTLGANYLPCYGYEKNTAPNLCQFSKDNILFENAYAQATYTLPSHMSLFTGVYPSTHQVFKTGVDRLNNKFITLDQKLKSEGYNTLYYGPNKNSWGAAFFPFDKGFGKGFDSVNENYDYNGISHWKDGLDRLAENNKHGQKTFLFLHSYAIHQRTYPYSQGNLQFTSNWNQKLINAEYGVNNVYDKGFVKLLVEFIESQKKETNDLTKTIKFNELLNKIKNGDYIESDLVNTIGDDNLFVLMKRWYLDRVSVNQTDEVIFTEDLYDQRIYELDKKLADVFEYFKKNNLEKDTIIIIVGDHGEAFNQHRTLFHCFNVDDEGNNCLYNEITKVPLIMKVPGIRQKVIKQNVGLIDIYSTIVSSLGLQTPPFLEGIDLTRYWKNNKNSIKRQYLVSEEWWGDKAVYYQNYKMISSSLNKTNTTFYKLFDLKTDQKESTNVYQTNNDMTNTMRQYFNEFNQAHKNYQRSESETNTLNNNERDELIKNGYFNKM